eukprot:scaffold6179_cov107-Skeletonema_dohrnii-CCMP3373.AAC.1
MHHHGDTISYGPIPLLLLFNQIITTMKFNAIALPSNSIPLSLPRPLQLAAAAGDDNDSR